jgi:hypothetical protein
VAKPGGIVLVAALTAALVGFTLAGSGPAGGGGWASLTPSPIERTEVGAGRIGDRIYVVGGFVAPGESTARMTRYDISADRWSEVRRAPLAVNHPGVTAHRGHLYLLGGIRDDGAPSDRLYRYDPERDRWKRLPDAPTARGALAFIGIGGRLYAAGGVNGTTGELQTLEIFDLERRRWSEGEPMPTGRNHVAAGVVKRTMVVTGGRTDEGANLDVVERYAPETDRWRSLARLSVPRSGHAAASSPTSDLRGRMVVFGGEELTPGGETIEQTELFQRRTGDWSPLPAMTTPRHGLGGVAFRDRIYAADGGPQPGFSFSSALETLRVAP